MNNEMAEIKKDLNNIKQIISNLNNKINNIIEQVDNLIQSNCKHEYIRDYTLTFETNINIMKGDMLIQDGSYQIILR